MEFIPFWGEPVLISSKGKRCPNILHSDSGGYKISALEIEREILEHPDVRECAVVGIPHEEWGQKIGAIITQKSGTKPLHLNTLREWLQKSLAPYKLPHVLLSMGEIPRNAMGKINKKELVALFAQEKQNLH